MPGKAIKPEIESLISESRFDDLRSLFDENLEPADIAEIIEDFDDEKAAILFRILPTVLALEVFEVLEFDSQENLIEKLSHEKVSKIVNEMAPDDRTHLFEELPGEITNRLLKTLTPEERSVARSLLNYPEESIGRLMTPQYLAVGPDWDVNQTLEHIRKNATQVETIDVIYVIDEKGRLIDNLSIGQLLLAEPGDLIREITNEQVISLAAPDDQEDAIEIFKHYDRTALPVTDRDGVILGIVTIDDVMDVVEEEETEDAHKFGGQEALEDSYFSTSLFDLARKRGGWLIILLIGSFFTVGIMKSFEDALLILPILSVFVPMIIATGGNTGTQSAALIIRGIAVREMTPADWRRIFRRELLLGLSLGIILGVLAAGFGLVIQHYGSDISETTIDMAENERDGRGGLVESGKSSLKLGLLIMFSITGIVVIGTLVGSMLPLFFKQIGFDPAVCSGPFITTFVDVSGIVIYFYVARWLLNLY
jgi:magnesium transporter